MDSPEVGKSKSHYFKILIIYLQRINNTFSRLRPQRYDTEQKVAANSEVQEKATYCEPRLAHGLHGNWRDQGRRDGAVQNIIVIFNNSLIIINNYTFKKLFY